MEIIDPSDEFAPLDQEKIDFLIELCSDLKDLESNDWLSTKDQECLKLTQHHMMVLMAQVIAGFELFKSRSSLAKDLYSDLKILIQEKNLDAMPPSLNAYEAMFVEDFDFD